METTNISFEQTTVGLFSMKSSTDSGNLPLQTLNDLVTTHTMTTHHDGTSAKSFWMSIIIFGAPSLAVCVVVGVACAIIFAIKKRQKSKQPPDVEEVVSCPEATPTEAIEPDLHVYEDLVEPSYCDVLTTLQRSLSSNLLDSGDYEEIAGGTLTAKVKSLMRKRILAETESKSGAQSQSSNSTASTSHAAEHLLKTQQGQADNPFISTSSTQVNNVDSSTCKAVPYSIIEFPFAGEQRRKVSRMKVTSASEKPLHQNEKAEAAENANADYETLDSGYEKLSPRSERKPRIYARLTEIFRPRPNKRNHDETGAAKDDC